MQSLHKAIKVLKAFTKDQPRLSLTELNKKTGISISSLQRFVSTLVYEGFLHKDERTKQYQLGLSLLYLGRLVEHESSLFTVAEPILKSLNEAIGESISMNIIEGGERRCILNFESTHTLSTKTYVGDTSPLYAGASSKSLLAYMPKDEYTQYMERINLEQVADRTILSKELLEQSLEQIRQQGYACSYSERVRGAYSVSAPILNPLGQAIASITIIIPEIRYSDYDERQLIKQIVEAAQDITKRIY